MRACYSLITRRIIQTPVKNGNRYAKRNQIKPKVPGMSRYFSHLRQELILTFLGRTIVFKRFSIFHFIILSACLPVCLSLCPEMTSRYTIAGGLRLVKPYYYTNQVAAKGRWVNRTVLDVFTKEFRDFDEETYRNRILDKKISILRKFKGTRERKALTGEILFETPIKNGDIVVHTGHKHEPAVTDFDIPIIHEDESVLVINKPSGIPIHPVQKYYYNSILEILNQEYNVGTLFVCHRLDKLTSGVLIFAKNLESVSKIQRQIQRKEVQKEYIARVMGQFPEGEDILCEDDVIVIDSKRKIDHGLMQKEAVTKFERLQYNKDLDQSIVRCIPLTGRTHQIRIHLRNMGFPIVNDPLYGPGGLYSKSVTEIDEEVFKQFEENSKQKRIDLLTGERCQDCHVMTYKDPSPDELVLWLHAKAYRSIDPNPEIPHWEYDTEAPDWSHI